MANVQIPNLPAAISLNGDEQLEAVQSGTTRRITTGQIAAFASGAPVPFPVSIGGTGAATFTAGYLKADGVNPFTTVATIPNTDITGLGTMSTQNSNLVSITGGSISGVTITTSTPLAISSGGTGQTTASAAAAALDGYLNIVSAAGTTTLTNTTARNILVTGTSTQTIVLPDVTTLALGWSFTITNSSTGNVTLQSSGGNSFPTTINVGMIYRVMCIAVTGTTTASWSGNFIGGSARTGSVSLVYSSQPSLVSPTMTTAIANQISGGTVAASTLTLQSTTGAGTTDAIIFNTGSQVERMRIRTDGNIGIGTAGVAGQSLVIGKNITGSVSSYGVVSNGSILSNVTSNAGLYFSNANTASNAGVPYTVSNVRHYEAFQGAFNADSTVSNQRGFSAGSSLIGATLNYGFIAENTAAVTAGRTAYGFYSAVNIASGGGTSYGFYADGTAPNIFPNINGGISASSTLTLQSTTGAGTTDSILFKVGNAGSVTALTIGTTGASTFGVSATSPSFTATRSTSATATSGAFAYGTMSYSDTNMIANFTSASTSYNQIVVQNTSAGATASANVNVSNDTATATTNFVELGINSSTFSGTGAFGAANYSYVASASTDLAIGTYGANAIHFVVNTGATDAMTIASTGAVSITSTLAVTTSTTSPLVIGGSAVGSTLGLRSTSASGTTDAIIMTTGAQAERVRVDSTGVVTFWQPAQTTVSGAATLTPAQVRTRIIQYTGAAATVTLPTGANLDTVLGSTMAVDTAFELTFINTTANLLTIGGNANTTVGLLTVAANTSGTFRFRKTATSTFTVYRIS